MRTITAGEFRKYGKTHKYKAQRTTIEGQHFPSKHEAAVYSLFLIRERSGDIRDLNRYERVWLSDARISYKPDWSYVDVQTSEKRYVEVKGAVTDRFRLIVKLWRAYGKHPLEVWKGDYRKPFLAETIYPGGR